MGGSERERERERGEAIEVTDLKNGATERTEQNGGWSRRGD